VASPNVPAYWDYYGRVWEYNPTNGQTRIYLEAGPYFANSPAEADYPEKHLSNPDGLNVIEIDGHKFLVIQEDINGLSRGRVPAGNTQPVCEVYLLDLSIQNPTIDDLIRLMATPVGAEVTGIAQTPDGKSLLINSQHPRTDNPFPWNHSLTLAIHGLDQVSYASLQNRSTFADPETPTVDESGAFSIYPNPTTRTVFLNKLTDVAIYDASGKRVLVKRSTTEVDVSQLNTGVYFLQNADGETIKLQIQ